MSQKILILSAAYLAASFCASANATIDWQVTVYADGAHNAFTDLMRWKEYYYLGFRHGESHMSMDGEIRVMRSADLKAWESCGTIDTFGDDRDAHFVATDDTLYLYTGVWDLVHAKDHGTPDRGSVRSHFATTQDGVKWSKVRGVYDSGFWLWRVSRHDEAFYSAAYTAVRPKPDVRETRLLRSTDGLEWSLVSLVTDKRLCGEADLLWRPDGKVWLFSRANDEQGDSVWFESDAAMKTWTARDVGVAVHSPVFATWNDRVFVSGRDYNKKSGSTTKIWEIKEEKLEEVITLPSGGDTGYSGLLADPTTLEGTAPALFISWYSQHETKTAPGGNKNAANIYVARVVLHK
jgi:hypothetical protein